MDLFAIGWFLVGVGFLVAAYRKPNRWSLKLAGVLTGVFHVVLGVRRWIWPTTSFGDPATVGLDLVLIVSFLLGMPLFCYAYWRDYAESGGWWGSRRHERR